jgi:hypothetical protein
MRLITVGFLSVSVEDTCEPEGERCSAGSRLAE